MGGFDSYCFICGGQATIARPVFTFFENASLGGLIPAIDSQSVKQFLFDAEDIAFQEDLVSLGPYDASEQRLIDTRRLFGDDPENDRLMAIDPASIRMIEGLIPGDLHELGGLDRRHPGPGHFGIDTAAYPFGHALCFRLLSAFAPRMMQPVGTFWATFRVLNGPGTEYSNCVNGVDFGDITGSLGQFVEMFHKYDPYVPGDWEDVPPREIRAVLNTDPLDPADVRNYWLKKGCMYVWVRPDKFPVREALTEPLRLLSCTSRPDPSHFSALPLDILLLVSQYLSLRAVLALLSLCTSLRAKLAGSINSLARQCLTWAIPSAVGEHERWDSLVAQVNPSVRSQEFPWLSYARQCELSPSMHNRRRIFGICQQYERIAISHGIL